MGYGWQIVSVDSRANLSLKDSNLIIKKDSGDNIVPLSQIKTLVINSQQCSLTVPLINELSNEGIKLILCDSKHNPCCEMLPKENGFSNPGIVIKQAKWDEYYKDQVWMDIVKNKIMCQINNLIECCSFYPVKMMDYYRNVTPGDKFNMEGQAARLYFNTLFGTGFNRRDLSDINGALNYGYTVLLSNINRIVSSHGYNLTLGINHHSMRNPYNLSCDIIEPFRVVIDKIVFHNQGRQLDNEYKAELISSLNKSIKYEGKEYKIDDAIEIYFKRIVDVLNNSNYREIGEIEIAG